MSRSRLAAVIVAVGLAQSGRTADLYFAADVPATIAGDDYRPYEIFHRLAAGYEPAYSLDPSIAIGAFEMRPDGLLLVAPAVPVTIGATTYEARDVIGFDGGVDSLVFDGSAAGVPAHARIDAIAWHPAVGLVISVDVPATLGAVDAKPADLVGFSAGTFGSYWDSTGWGVPPGTNLVGATIVDLNRTIVSFDVPATVGALAVGPRDLVEILGTTFSSFDADAAWPPAVRLADFAGAPAAGRLGVGWSPLLADKATIGSLQLSWRGSCLATDTDFEIYQGTLGTWYDHAAIVCGTGGSIDTIIAEPTGNSYFLVVPRNGFREGSYGTDSANAQRPTGSGACRPQVLAGCS